MIDIITASENEIPVVENILLDTVRWLESIGQPLWNEQQVKWAQLSKEFAISDFRIALLDGAPAACLAVVDYDHAVWPEVDKGESFFIRKLAVKRFAAGKGLPEALFAHVKTMCSNRRINAIRLTCAKNRLKLRAVYERNGFTCVGEKIIFEKYPSAFYLCEVSETFR